MEFSGEEKELIYHSKFLKHLELLIWKNYTQRMRRWPIAAAQTLFSFILLVIAVFCAKPVFLTPLQLTPQTPLNRDDIMTTLSNDTQLGYAPDTAPYNRIMAIVSASLNKVLLSGITEQELDNKLYRKAKGQTLKHHVIWVIWKEKEVNVWKFSIRSSELAHIAQNKTLVAPTHNRHLRVGFLAVQMAVSEALLATETKMPLRHKIELKLMPMSPLMQKERVSRAMVWVLLCYTLAFIPPMMEVALLVVRETANEYKRALIMRNVSYSCIYLGWLTYLLITALPTLILATCALMLIFRWVWVFLAFLFLGIYVIFTAMITFMICMFVNKPIIAAVWTAFFIVLELFMAELLVYHGFDGTTPATVLLHILLPPLGLVHGFNEFALLQTGRERGTATGLTENPTILIWIMMIFIYMGLLLMLQRTTASAIGGRVSWRSIIFKKDVDPEKLHHIKNPDGNERDRLQEVDEFVAKAISFKGVNKSIMGVPMVRNLTFDVYRGEYTQLFADRVQERMLIVLENLITGLTLPDDGSVNVLGHDMAALAEANVKILNLPNMLGFCHRHVFLVGELTVNETLMYFTKLSLWNHSPEDVEAYIMRNTPKLCAECDLLEVQDYYVRNLDLYYKAQLCWAIAMLLEPKIVFIQWYTGRQKFESVITDKVVKNRTRLTIVEQSFSKLQAEHADRVFLFDRKVLVFGGSPAYMFFKYGREYRVRMTFRAHDSLDNLHVEKMLDHALGIGAQVRAYVGTLLILSELDTVVDRVHMTFYEPRQPTPLGLGVQVRLYVGTLLILIRVPTTPTDKMVEFVTDITENAAKYGIVSVNISLPDSEEIFKRAIKDSRDHEQVVTSVKGRDATHRALREFSGWKPWKMKKSCCLTMTLLKQIVWKYVSFYIHYRLYMIITLLSAIATGGIIGSYLSFHLTTLEETLALSKIQHGEKMTVEALQEDTTLVLKVWKTSDAVSIATAYTMSHTNAKEIEVKKMKYTALPYTESMTEYLVLRAIDSPLHYVYAYAYGIDVKDHQEKLEINVLYSPIHHDTAAAARSLARTYTALLRHYTAMLDADIEVTDDPLVLDAAPVQSEITVPPLIIHFMLVLTISHITLLPTMEYGLIRHMQCHAMNFSPARYWFSLFFCDILLHWVLVFVISTVLFCVMYWVASEHFLHSDLAIIPFMLVMYGISCVPQAYVFSLGPSPALNSMTFIIFNIIFGEASVISQFIKGEAFNYAERALSLSPQYNVANAFVRITKIFVYNSECVLFNNKKLCSSNVLHKCCPKCGIMQPCFERTSYLSHTGILDEVLWTLYHAILFSFLLAMWEYRVPHRLWYFVCDKWDPPDAIVIPEESGARREQNDAAAKWTQIEERKNQRTRLDTFGEHLLAHNLTITRSHTDCKGISVGIGKGDALALVGLSRHGRQVLSEVLAGYRVPSSGYAAVMSRWSLTRDPHNYARNVVYSCVDRSSLPSWMTVYDALWLLGVLRGVPEAHLAKELANLLEALELSEKAYVNVYRLHRNERCRLHFAAAMIGAPPVLVLDQFTEYQNFSVVRAMFYMLYALRTQGHALLISSASVEDHLPVANRLAILLNGRLVDVDQVDTLVNRYSAAGYTVVVHLKDDVDIQAMFKGHFQDYAVNAVADGLANIQIKDNLDYAEIFQRMEALVLENSMVYSYIISVISIDYVVHGIIDKGSEFDILPKSKILRFISFITSKKKKKKVDIVTLKNLQKFEKKYDILSLKELPWSVIFRR